MPSWTIRQRDYAAEAPLLQCEVADTHPLLEAANRIAEADAAAAAAAAGKKKEDSKEGSSGDAAAGADAPLSSAADPLSAAATSDPLSAAAAVSDPLSDPLSADPLGALLSDPLSDPLSGGMGGGNGDSGSGGDAAGSDMGAQGTILLASGTAVAASSASSARVSGWKEKRAKILKQFATSGQVRVQSDLLDADGVSATTLGSNIDEAGPSGEKRVALDTKTRRRLEQLETSDGADGRTTLKLTQSELVSRVDRLNQELRHAWQSEERVRALKIAIQASKMLGDTSFPTFFPTIFAVVAEMLDAFGELVYERVLAKGTPRGRVLPPGFLPEEVAEEGAETTKNWFYKVASIRELVPRFYVEIAILKCYKLIMPQDELPKIVERLSRALRGFGDPLAATYARSYLVHKAIDLTPHRAYDLVKGPVDDTIRVFELQLKLAADGSGALAGLHHVKAQVTPAEYFATFQPALEWLLQSLAEYHPTQETLVELVKTYRAKSKSSLFLNAIIGAFEPAVVAKNAMPMCELIVECDARGFSRHHLYVSLGRVLCAHPPPRDELLPVLNAVWGELGASKSAAEYVDVAAQYLQLLLRQFGVPEVHKLLRDLLKRVVADKAYAQLGPALHTVVGAVLQNAGPNLGPIFALEPFQRLLALFDRPTALENYKNVMEAFAAARVDGGGFSDPALVHNLTHAARQLHDSLDSLSFDDERRQLSRLINAVVSKVSFGADDEAQLNFYVECRGAFANLEAVQETLVLGVARLAMRVRSAVKGRHTKRTSAFAKACAAFMYITTPTIDAPLLRIRLHLLGAQVALCNGLLPQMDAFFKAAVTEVKEVTAAPVDAASNAATREANAREEQLVGLLCAACSLLVAVPGHPTLGPFYLATGALNVIQSASWRLPASRLTLYGKMLGLFCAYGQRRLPYAVPGVDSNDTLYASEPEYAEKLHEVIGAILGQVDGAMGELAERAEAEAAAKRALVASAIGLFELVLGAAALSGVGEKLAVKLFGLAAKAASTRDEKAWLARLVEHVGAKAAQQQGLGGGGGGAEAEPYRKLRDKVGALLPK